MTSKRKTLENTTVKFKPKTQNQYEYVRAISENDLTFATGPAGSGKTCCGVAVALQHLLDGRVNKIILTRPIVESGRSIGFLPGDAISKVQEYMVPLLEELYKFLDPIDVQRLMKDGTIQILPLSLSRGRNLSGLTLVDEAQNASMKELKLIITRMTQGSKMVISGDVTQSDLPLHEQGALQKCCNRLSGLDRVAIIELLEQDIVRHDLIAQVLRRLENGVYRG